MALLDTAKQRAQDIFGKNLNALTEPEFAQIRREFKIQGIDDTGLSRGITNGAGGGLPAGGGTTQDIFNELQQLRKSIGLERPEGTEVAKQIQTNLREPEKSPGFQLAQNLLSARSKVKRDNLSTILQKSGLGGTVSGPGLERLVSGERQTDIDLGNLALGTSERARGEAIDLTRLSEGVFGLESGRARTGAEFELEREFTAGESALTRKAEARNVDELIKALFAVGGGKLLAASLPGILDALFGKDTSTGASGGIINNLLKKLFGQTTKSSNLFDPDPEFDIDPDLDFEDTTGFFDDPVRQTLTGAGAAGLGLLGNALFGGGVGSQANEDIFGDFLNFPDATGGAGVAGGISKTSGSIANSPSEVFNQLGPPPPGVTYIGSQSGGGAVWPIFREADGTFRLGAPVVLPDEEGALIADLDPEINFRGLRGFVGESKLDEVSDFKNTIPLEQRYISKENAQLLGPGIAASFTNIDAKFPNFGEGIFGDIFASIARAAPSFFIGPGPAL